MANFYDKVFAGLACESWSLCSNELASLTINKAAATLVAVAIAIVCYVLAKKFSTRGKPPLPPGPPGLPILGNLPFIQPDNLHQYVTDLSQTYGPIIKLRLGSKVWIVINSPSIAKEVLKDHGAIFANRDSPAAFTEGLFGGLSMVWRPYDSELRELRKIVAREMMSSKSLEACYGLRRGAVRQIVKDIYGKVGSSVDVGHQTFRAILNVIMNVLWGGSLSSQEISGLEVEFRKQLVEFVELAGAPNVSDVFPVLRPLDLQGIQSKTKKTLSWFYEIFESVIAQHTKLIDEGKRRKEKDFLQQMLELKQQGGDDKALLSTNQVKAVLLDLIVGATDTTSTTVEWAMTELLRYPDKMRKVQEELETVVGNQNMVEESHFPQLLYLEAVVKETLRMHPPAPLLVPRSPSKTCTVAGFTIPKHSNVLINAWAIQRNPEFWEDPLQFEPERFIKNREKGNYLSSNFHFFPFGYGRRMCSGIPLAEKMISHLLGNMVHSFEWKLPDGREPDVKGKFGIVMAKMEPLVAIPIARLPNGELYQ